MVFYTSNIQEKIHLENKRLLCLFLGPQYAQPCPNGRSWRYCNCGYYIRLCEVIASSQQVKTAFNE